MRLWHKDLIEVLPRQQLLSQWRECCCIAKSISVSNTPNHILVNKIMDYPLDHLWNYSINVYNEMIDRGYNPNISRLKKWFSAHDTRVISYYDIFKNWHNDRYLLQCYYNLQEKYDCGGISKEEWLKLAYHVRELTFML